MNKITGETITETSSDSISLSYSIEPTYSVVLPSIVDVSNDTSQFSIRVSGDIYADAYLEVIFAETSKITNGRDNETVYVSQEKTHFTYSELSDSGVTSTITLTHGSLKAGTYSGQLNLTITLKGEQYDLYLP